MKIIKKTFVLDGKEISIETGKLAPRANGSVVVSFNKTKVLVTASANLRKSHKKPFLALTVDFVEKLYASGKIPTSFHRREGKPSLTATLSARVVDRSIRPMFEKNFDSEVHVVVSVLSYDGTIEPAVLGIIGASSALLISDIPFHTPIAAINVGFREGPVLGPNVNLDLIVAGSKDNIVMVEASANEISEQKIVDAINYAHEQMQGLIALQEELCKEVAPEKYVIQHKEGVNVSIEDLKEVIKELECKSAKDKVEKIQKMIDLFIEEKHGNLDDELKLSIEASCNQIIKAAARKLVLKNKERLDGRSLDQVRDIDIDINYLPMAHGSALFSRGNTQSLGSVTLGSIDSQQLIDGLDIAFRKRFFLHYNFPPFSTGGVGFMKAPGRRELGHGNLAEMAIEPILPSEEEFPYTIRVVSDILSSNGSSSMASVCSASLSLMSAGVPIKRAVAGVAMGLIKEENDFGILTDITGFEDGMGDMDFKVAGTYRGITALQMDIKTDGINREIMVESLGKAKIARVHILDVMNKVISKAGDLSSSVPRYSSLFIDKEKISLLIGPGGKNIKYIIEKTSSDINVGSDGKVDIFSPSSSSLEETIRLINYLTKDIEVGNIMDAEVKKIIPSGAFLEISKGRDGFLHISELSDKRVERIQDHIEVGDVVRVEVANIDPHTKKVKLKKVSE
tara:strand:+ start:5632 stop:7671 length:2040 start_codon:yes stop_codon:yes gene_type:complete